VRVSTQPIERVTNWGRWGDDDERGALNLITPDRVQAAAAAVTTGKVYSLGIPIQSTGVPLMDYRGTPLRLTLMNESDDGRFAVYGAADGVGAHEDVLVFASHTTSHMDALCHVYEGHQHYNGVAAAEMKTNTGAGRLGIEKVGSIAGRGVLLDIPKVKGSQWLDPGYVVTAADLSDEDHRRLNGAVEQVLLKQACSRDELLRTLRELVGRLVPGPLALPEAIGDD